jgi:hypothetical protein
MQRFDAFGECLLFAVPGPVHCDYFRGRAFADRGEAIECPANCLRLYLQGKHQYGIASFKSFK